MVYLFTQIFDHNCYPQFCLLIVTWGRIKCWWYQMLIQKNKHLQCQFNYFPMIVRCCLFGGPVEQSKENGWWNHSFEVGFQEGPVHSKRPEFPQQVQSAVPFPVQRIIVLNQVKFFVQVNTQVLICRNPPPAPWFSVFIWRQFCRQIKYSVLYIPCHYHSWLA